MSDAKYCKDCKNMSCPESRVNCKNPDAIACDLYRDTPPTLFHRISASPEVLAEAITYPYDIRIAGGGENDWKEYWTSPLTQKYYPTKSEAIAATVAKLKEFVE